MFVNRNYGYWAKVTQQLTLFRRYSQLVANRCCRRVRYSRHRSSSETSFFRKICSWTDLFVMRGVREPRFHCILLATRKTRYTAILNGFVFFPTQATNVWTATWFQYRNSWRQISVRGFLLYLLHVLYIQLAKKLWRLSQVTVRKRGASELFEMNRLCVKTATVQPPIRYVWRLNHWLDCSKRLYTHSI
jgi:hypothetical protein